MATANRLSEEKVTRNNNKTDTDGIKKTQQKINLQHFQLEIIRMQQIETEGATSHFNTRRQKTKQKQKVKVYKFLNSR